jgi:hypothetical protein
LLVGVGMNCSMKRYFLLAMFSFSFRAIIS